MKQGFTHDDGRSVTTSMASPRPSEPTDWSAALAVFDALSRPGRLAAFRSLVRAGEAGADAGELKRELRTTASALTLHLRCLADAGLIHQRGGRAGRFVADVQRLNAVLRTIGAQGRPTP